MKATPMKTTKVCVSNLFLLLLLSLVGVAAEILQSGTMTTLTVRYNAMTQTFSVTEGERFGVVAATVNVNNSFAQTGWDVVAAAADNTFLHAGPPRVHAEQRRLAYMAIGYGEGYATQRSLEATINNTFLGDGGLGAVLAKSPAAVTWVEKHVNHMYATAAVEDSENAYRGQLRNLLAMLNGIVDGYNARVEEDGGVGFVLNRTWLFYLNFQAEIGDVVASVSSKEVIEELQKTSPRFFTHLHCSALVKVTEEDIYFSHATWNSFNSMLRQFKTYRVGNSSVTMSSYPGLIHSMDDWYMTHARLAVMETTNGIYNQSLYTYITPYTVSEFLRVMIANFVANDSPSWVQYFSYNNSGTYNNQWMVLNMNQVVSPRVQMPANTFWVAEQLPGKTYPLGVTAADMTSHLNEHGFWASYNIPFFQNVYNISGYEERREMYGDFFSYTQTARAQIFHRNQSQVVDLETMKRLMRYNNYKEDPFSLIPNCTGVGVKNNKNTCDPAYSAMLSIASRGDLNPVGDEKKYGPLYHYLGRREHGATDAKITSWSQMTWNKNKYFSHVICGPTSDQQPVFEWTDNLFNTMPPIYGLPKVYNFSFVRYEANVPPLKPADEEDKNVQNKWIGIAIGVAATSLACVSIGIALYRSRRRSAYISEEVLLVE